MPARFQLVIDCADPDRLARFWADALGYELAPPRPASPPGTTTTATSGCPRRNWVSGRTGSATRRATGRASGSRWSRTKAVKNRLHLDIHASGGRTDPIQTRKQRVDAEASRLAGLGATITGIMYQEGLDHYAVAMKDPEGNEFDIN